MHAILVASWPPRRRPRLGSVGRGRGRVRARTASTARHLVGRRVACPFSPLSLTRARASPQVAGNFHFSLTKADHHVLMSVYGQRDSINVSHVIHGVSFGEPYPDMVNPLDNTPKILHEGSGYFQYYIKIVPTVYEPLRGAPLHTNQYSYTELFRTVKELDKLPAVYFHYELSPIMAKRTESRKSYSSFLTGLCAIVGGVVTMAGMVDSLLHKINRLTANSDR